MEKKPIKPKYEVRKPENMDNQDCISTSQMRYGHPRMSPANRAKIFMPFDALKGLREALEQREKEALATIKDFDDLPE